MSDMRVCTGWVKKRPPNFKSKYLSNHSSYRNGSVLKTKLGMSPVIWDISQYSRMLIAGEMTQILQRYVSHGGCTCTVKSTGCTGRRSICVIPPAMSILEYWEISHMTGDIHIFVLSTEPFLWDEWLLRYLYLKLGGLFFDSPCIRACVLPHMGSEKL